jgi:hypothetical protein
MICDLAVIRSGASRAIEPASHKAAETRVSIGLDPAFTVDDREDSVDLEESHAAPDQMHLWSARAHGGSVPMPGKLPMSSLTEAILETITQPLLILDGELRVVAANPAFF